MLFASSVAVTHRTLGTLDLVIIGIYFALVFWHWLLFFEKGTHLRGIFPCRPQHRLVRHRRITLCIEHFHGTLHRSGGFRRDLGSGRRPF